METPTYENRIVIYGYVSATAMEELAEQILIDGVVPSKGGPRCETVEDILAVAAKAEAEGRPLEFHADRPHVPFIGAEGILRDYGIEFQIVAPFHANGTDFKARHYDGRGERYRRTPLEGGAPFSAEPRRAYAA